MTDRFQNEVKHKLGQLESSKGLILERLKQIGDQSDKKLIKTVVDGRAYYYLHDTASGKRKYLGVESNEDVLLIKEARFCKVFNEVADRDIALLQKLLKNYKQLDYDHVNAGLPKAYQDAKVHLGTVIRQDKRATEWIKQKKAVKSKEKKKYSENLKHKAADGTMVRSKSEVIIADMLFMNNIPYVYEVPYVFDGEILNLDFTVLSTKDYETEIVIEHQGMMDQQRYRDKYMHTLTTCLEQGMTPNVDIYFTFDDINGNFNSRQVWDIINNRLK